MVRARCAGLTVRLAEAPDWDLYGASAMTTMVRDRFEQVGDAHLAGALTAVAGMCRPETYRTAAGRSVLIAQLTRMFTGLRRGHPVAVLIDDVHSVVSPLPGVAAACRAGCVVVATYTEAMATASMTPLIEVAERTVVQAPLSRPAMEAAVSDWAGMPAEPATLSALWHGLGPLAGNPATLIATLRELSAQDRLVERRGVLVLRRRCTPFALPADHQLVSQVNELDESGRALVALAGTPYRISVEELAGYHGRALDQLVHIGALVEDSVGRAHCPYPALIARVNADLGDAGTRRVHALFVRYLLRSGHVDAVVLADQVIRAGTALPLSPQIVGLLVGDGSVLSVLSDQPEKSARRYHAALLHADADHADIDRIVSGLLRLLIQLGRFDWLGEVVADLVAAGTTAIANRAELACAAALSTLHTGHAVPEGVREFLSETPGGDRPLLLCDSWLAGYPGISAGQVAEVFAPLGAVLAAATTPRSTHRHDDLLFASSRLDLVAVFEDLFGSAYRAPSDGPLVAYHRVLAGYVGGDWDAALSSAADFDLAASADTTALRLIRLFAAEICANRADYRQARSWLADVPVDGRLAAARSWVEIGMRAREGNPDLALQAGWRAYLDAVDRGEDVAMGLLRLRLACGAVHRGHAAWQRRLLADAEAAAARSGGGAADATLLMVRARVTGDENAAREAVELARSQGYLVQYAQACVIAAHAAADPAPMLREAHAVAERLGAESLRAMIRSVMRTRGVSTPRCQVCAEGLSHVDARIVEMIRTGLTNRQIALRLQLSEKAVEYHLTRLFERTGCRTRVDLAAASIAGRLAECSA